MTRVPVALMVKMADPVSLAPLALPDPLDSEAETLLPSTMVRRPLTPALDPWVLWAPEAPLDHLAPLDLKDTLDTLVSLESPVKLELLDPVDPLDPLANLEKMVTMADLESLETEEPPALRALVDSLEPPDFPE